MVMKAQLPKSVYLGITFVVACIFCIAAAQAIAADDQVVPDDWDMLEITFCPEEDLPHTFAFTLFDIYGDPLSGASTRLYYYSQTEDESLAFCNDPGTIRSEYFYQTSSSGNHYTFDIDLGAGTDTSYDTGWLRMRVEWGTNYSEWDMFPELYEASPDLNGDLEVNVSDAGIFTGILNGDYDSRADFNHDDVVNVSDAGVMTAHIGHECQ